MLPLAVLTVAVVTVHAAALMGYEWQWTLAKWGYPLLCVGALYALVFLKHWSVRSALGIVMTLMVVVATAGYAYKAGIDSNGGLFTMQTAQWAESIKHAEGERDTARKERDESQAEVAGLRAELARRGPAPDLASPSAAAEAPKAECKPLRAYRPKPAPSVWDWLP